MIGSTEIIIIAAVVFLLFGASFIPKFARSLGEAKKELNKLQEEEDE
jgi:sec-independent protein translocase protein TatA